MSKQAASLENVTGQDLIHAYFIACIRKGQSVNEVFDRVFGEGAYSQFAGEVYHALRAKQGLQ